MIETMIIL